MPSAFYRARLDVAQYLPEREYLANICLVLSVGPGGIDI